MSNFEHIDDYLTNRLAPAEKANFERQLETDGALRADVEFQKLTIEAIKQARVAQLKSMLNNVPIGGSGFSTGLTTAKIAGGVISIALIGGLTYFYLQGHSKNNEIKPIDIATQETTKPVNPVSTASDSITKSIAVVEPSKTNNTAVSSSEKADTKKTEQQTVSKPKIEVLDLSEELSTNDNNESALIENRKPEITASRVEVSTDSSHKKYSFHYQFSHGKLLLYGSFDKGLYEILEINGGSHNVFLFYQANYYLLEEKENTTSPLEPVKDPILLKKLKEYRTR